jgi:ABC-type multidrug transport system ATPase subunit
VIRVEALVRTKNLARRFGSVEAVRDLTLEVRRGEVFALLGPNGAGKTTAMRTIANVLEPTGGRAEVLGVDSRRLGPLQLRRIGYVSESQDLPDGLSGEELLAFLRPLYPTWDDAFARELAVQFRLPLARRLRHLSRGMRMKTALVSSLAYRPELLLLDEPFAGLDPLVREEVIDGVLSLGDREGWTVLLCSHDVDEVERLADRVGIVDHGALALVEEVESLLARYRTVETILDAPDSATPPLPESWAEVRRGGRTLRFVESRFDPQRTAEDVRRLFPGSSGVAASSMSLRAIFLTLARQFRLFDEGDLA